MTNTPPPFLPTPKVEPYSGQAHSITGDRAHRCDALGLALNIPKASGEEIGRGRFELPLSARRRPKIEDDGEEPPPTDKTPPKADQA